MYLHCCAQFPCASDRVPVRCSMRNVRGVTLLEVLIVIAVIGILLALLAPAVQYVRASSRQVQCTNNLKQLGIAANTYAATYSCFPPAYVGKSGTFSFFVALLPELGEGVLYSQLNLNASVIDSDNILAARRKKLPLLLCPECNGYEFDREGLVFPTAYAGNLGSGDWDASSANGTIVFGGLPLSQVADGLTQTALASEWACAATNQTDGPFGYQYSIGAKDLTSREHFVQQCIKAPHPAYRRPVGTNWMVGSHGVTLYNHQIPPNSPGCDPGIPELGNGISYNADHMAYTASSFHGDGVNVLFCDGHVDWQADNVGLEIWRSISTRNGGF